MTYRQILDLTAVICLRILIAAGIICCFTGVAKAEKVDTFPSGADADVAIEGAHAGIDAPTSWFEITTDYTYSGSITVTLKDACVNGTAGSWGLRATLYDGGNSIVSRDTNSSCSGNDLILPDVSMSGRSTPSKYEFELKVLTLRVDKINGEGHQSFRVQVSGGNDSNAHVSYREDTNRDSPDINNKEAFGVWIHGATSFKFRPSCDKLNSSFYLKWKDADVNLWNQDGLIQHADLHTALLERDLVTNNIVRVVWSDQGPSLGGSYNAYPPGSPDAPPYQDMPGHSPLLTARDGYYYEWTWSNVDTNAMQVVVPFSQNSFSSGVRCNHDPTGDLYSISNKCDYIKGWAEDPDRSSTLQYQVLLDGKKIASGIAGANGVPGHDGHSFVKNVDFSSYFQGTRQHTFKLQVKGVSPTGVVAVDWTDVGSPKVVSRNCTGGGNAAVGSCFATTVTDDGRANSGYASRTRVAINGAPAVFNESVGLGGGGEFGTYSGSHTWQYFPAQDPNGTPRGTVRVLIIHEEYKDNPIGSNKNFSWVETSRSDVTHVCFSATCQIVSIDEDDWPEGPSDGVKAGHDYTIHAQITATGESPLLPHAAYGANLGLTTSGGGSSYPINQDINQGETQPMDITFRASGTATIDNISFYPDFYGWTGLGGACTYPVDVYGEFNISLSASSALSPDDEAPSAVIYSTTVCNSASFSVHVPTSSAETKTPAGGASTTIDSGSGGDYGCGPTFSGRKDLNEVNAGDQYCAHIDAAYTHGYRGGKGAGDVVQTDKPDTADSCSTVHNQPYTHFFGSSASAGGGFGSACSSSAGTIRAYIKSTTQSRGSGSQFGAFALGVLEGLGSSSMRSAPAKPAWPTGLSFSNTSHADGSGLPAAALGGYFGDSSCLPDYFGVSKPATLTTADTTNSANVGADGAQYYKPGGTGSGTLTLTGGGLGAKQSIFVEGNVYITGAGVIYSNPGGWASVNDVPAFYLVAKGGNIYIDPSVKQLDGIYIAQPTTDSSGHTVGGQINTCATAGGGAPGNSIYNSCKNQLVVNGAFVADRVFLNRSYSSLRYSTAAEYLTNANHVTCGNSGLDVPAGSVAGPDCAAEIFNFSPEIYLPRLPNNASTGPPGCCYDYVTSLSPVL